MNDPSIDILTQRLAEAEIDPQMRDALASDLDWAAQINGHPEPAMQGVKRLVVCGVRRELLACDRDHKTQTAISEILKTCAMRHGDNAETSESGAKGKISVFFSFVKALTPWRWPLALAACSPWSADFVKAVVEACK